MKYSFPPTLVFKVALFFFPPVPVERNRQLTVLNERYMNHKIAGVSLMYMFKSSGFSSFKV